MAIFNRLTKEEIAGYTHEGLFCGCVPIYARHIESDIPDIVEKNWCPAWAIEAVAFIFDCFSTLNEFEEGYPMRLWKNKLYKGGKNGQ